MPADWKAFKKDWKNGKYLECTPLLERPKYTRRAIPIKFLDRLVEFSNLLEKHNATAFLMGGTLLGWARECSLIPHTTDTDVGIFRDDHSDSLLREILTSKIFEIHWVLGRLKNSFELSVYVDGNKIDLFYLYKTTNSTENASIGGMRHLIKQRLRWNYPKLSGEICAAEMHGRLFHVLCDYYKIVESDYGKEEWKKDHHTSNFAWDKSNKNKESMEIYTEAEWPNVYLYVGNKNDRFDSKKVDEWIKNYKQKLYEKHPKIILFFTLILFKFH
uniref:Uncharacterized protein n=1 Tax=Meloidogyne incognita TaxID=6306 RepID=A0A914MEU3_MELIC